MRGARSVAHDILEAHPATDVRVLAVWVGVRGDGKGSGDPHSILGDRRVTHLSDPDADIGFWFGARDRDFHAGPGLAWDAFMLFDSAATFATLSDHLEVSGRTIIADRVKLQKAFAPTGA
jgi:hypothetical protein